jgi:hypothetical protein
MAMEKEYGHGAWPWKRSMAMKDALVRFTLSSDMKEKFMQYCNICNITMTNFLISKISEVIETDLEANPGELPAEEKNSDNNSIYRCPFCGSKTDQKTLEMVQKHLENCKNGLFRSKNG